MFRMRILVAGSEGSLMQRVIPLLLRRGHEVIGVDSFVRHGRIERKREYEFVEGDLCDKDLVYDVCSGVEAIIQAAARVYGVRGFHKYPADILSCDLQAHHNLLQAARKFAVKRFVYISSSMVYERSEKIPSAEEDVDSVRVPRTAYGLSKLVGERLCQAFHQQYGLEYTIWRPFNIITPYEEAEPEPGMAHVFADFIHKIVVQKQNPMRIFGDGEQIRCFTWIDDVAYAIAEYSFIDRTRCEVFNLGNPEPITMKDLALRIFEKAKERGLFEASAVLRFEHEPAYEDDVRVRIPCIDKARSVLGWTPTVSLDEALDRCVEEALCRVARRNARANKETL